LEPLPYRLPELLAASSSKLVFIAEGEKDVDNVAKLGLTATCNHGGAMKWRREISKWLKGYDVVILPDNDGAGRDHAEDVAKKLHGIVTRIRILELPDLPEKGDVSDWIAAGGTAEELLRLADEAPDWRHTNGGDRGHSASDDGFKRNDRGLIVANSQHNIKLAIRKLGASLSHDTFADQLLIDGLEGAPGEPLGDAEMIRLYMLIDEKFHFRPTKEFFYDVVEDTARKAGFHPVIAYLASLTWDGTPRIDTWLSRYASAEDNEYARAVSRIILIAAVRRVRQPGCKFDEMPVIESGQGLNKSTAFRVLAVKEEWFGDDLPLNCDAREVIERLHGRWIVEAAELQGMKRGDIEHIKAFLSRAKDRARAAFGRFAVTKPRQCIFVGSTNSPQYLKDTTGNRRFWPVKVQGFDIEALKRDVDQLWAEAAKAEADGESIRLDPKLYAAAGEQQEQRQVEDPWLPILAIALSGIHGKLRCADAWVVVDAKVGTLNQSHNERMGDAMKKLGWQRGKASFDGKKQNAYFKEGSADDDRDYEGKWPRVSVWRDSEGKLHVEMASRQAESDRDDDNDARE
jgi:predicted P-loop ATPase